VARAAFESIAYQIRDALDAMRVEACVPLVALHGDGGPTASKFLMQFTADLTGVELRVASMPDCSPLGAVFSGQLGLGVHRSIDSLAAAPREEIVYRPTMSVEDRAALYTGWQTAVRQGLRA
jgi:glycerol kinase